MGSEVKLKETNETGIIIAETEDDGNGVIYYVVKLDNEKYDKGNNKKKDL